MNVCHYGIDDDECMPLWQRWWCMCTIMVVVVTVCHYGSGDDDCVSLWQWWWWLCAIMAVMMMNVCHYGSDDGEHYGSDNDECAMMTEGCATAPVLQTGRTAFQCLQYYQQHLNTEMLSRCHCCCLCWIPSETLVFSVHCFCLSWISSETMFSVHCCCLLDLFWNSVFWPLLLSLGSLLKQCFLATAAVSWISSESLVFSSVYLSHDFCLHLLGWMGWGGRGDSISVLFCMDGYFGFFFGGGGGGGLVDLLLFMLSVVCVNSVCFAWLW